MNVLGRRLSNTPLSIATAHQSHSQTGLSPSRSAYQSPGHQPPALEAGREQGHCATGCMVQGWYTARSLSALVEGQYRLEQGAAAVEGLDDDHGGKANHGSAAVDHLGCEAQESIQEVSQVQCTGGGRQWIRDCCGGGCAFSHRRRNELGVPALRQCWATLLENVVQCCWTAGKFRCHRA